MKRLVAASIALVTLILLLAFARLTERAATLRAAQAAPPDALADPSRDAVLYENDVAQMIRVTFPAGGRSVMHSHPAGCAISSMRGP